MTPPLKYSLHRQLTGANYLPVPQQTVNVFGLSHAVADVLDVTQEKRTDPWRFITAGPS